MSLEGSISRTTVPSEDVEGGLTAAIDRLISDHKAKVGRDAQGSAFAAELEQATAEYHGRRQEIARKYNVGGPSDEFVVTKDQQRSPEWMRNNQSKIHEAHKANRLRFA